MKRMLLAVWLAACLTVLSGCGGGQEIESCLFVLSMAVDPAPDGNLTVTVKALSGTQEAVSASDSSEGDRDDPPGAAKDEAESAETKEEADAESPEPGYIILSATAPSSLRALNMLSATTPRTVNLSQLREIVINRTLAETDATLTILKEIYGMFRANGEAIVVVTPDDAGDFIRRQRAVLGIRLSKYLEVLFGHFSQIDMIPPYAQMARVIAAMESDIADAAAVYAAGNAFDSALVLSGGGDLDRLPGHLPRTSPAENEYLGAALFSGPRMTGVLTGEETGLLCLLMGKARRRTQFIGNAQYKANLPTHVKRHIDPDGTLSVHVRMNLTRVAGSAYESEEEIAAQIERAGVNLLHKLSVLSCDAVGFGALAIRKTMTVGQWQQMGWPQAYERLPVRVTADVKVL